MSELHIIIAVFSAYLLLLAALAFWSRHAVHTVSGYYLAGKRLPYWVVAFSTNATGESGWLILGLTGMGYAVGLHAFWVVLGELIGVTLSWTLVARRFKRSTDYYNSVTVPDYLESRFCDGRHVLRCISVAVIVIMTCTYIGAQLVATGKAFSQFMEMDYVWGVVLGALVTLAYTTVGGFKAVAYSDFVQGILMVAGLVILPVAAFNAAGGWGPVLDTLRNTDPALLSAVGKHGMSAAGLFSVAGFLAVGLPFLGVPQLLVRFMSIRKENDIRVAACISVFTLTVLLTGAVLTGIAGRALFPDLTDSELIMPTLSRELFPPIVTGVLMVVLLAALMSTVDSLFLLASSAVTRDLTQRIINPEISDQLTARLGRYVTLAVGIAGLLIALVESRTIFWFALFSWSGLGATFGPVVLCSLYYRGITTAGAAAGMLGGFGTTVIWVLFFKEYVYGLYEMIPGFIVGMSLIFIVSSFENKSGSEHPKVTETKQPE